MSTIGETPRLRYDEGCLAAHALNLIGDRWALLVVRELMLRDKRFQAIRTGLPGITAGVLTQRLSQLIEAGVAHHDPETGLYGLTGSGRALQPVLVALCHWGSQHPGHDPRRFISPTALMISMSAKINTAAAAGCGTVAGIAAGNEAFTLRLDKHGALLATPGLQNGCDFILSGSGNTLARAIYGPQPVAALQAADIIALEGDASAAQSFVDLFSLRHIGDIVTTGANAGDRG